MTFDPSLSFITYTSAYGSDTQLSFEQLESLAQTRLTQGILFGTRIGAAGLAIIVLWMITKNRKTPIFVINQVSLSFLFLHSVLYIGYLFRHYASIIYNLTMFTDFVPRSDVYLYGAINIFQVLLVISIEVSLTYQIRVIFKSDNYKRIGRVLMVISIVLAVVTAVMYLVTAIKSMITIYSDISGNPDTVLFNVSTILLSCSVNFMTLILTSKLLLAIRSRRFLGLKQFDSFHILMIMSCQTLILPSIFFILAYALNKNQGTDTLASVATLLVTLSLPLSSMWATAANNSSYPTSVNTQYSSSMYDTESDRFEKPSLYTHSAKSSVNYKKYQNHLYDIYPVTRDQMVDHGCNDADLEKNQTRGTNISIRDGESAPGRGDRSDVGRLDVPGYDLNDASSASKDMINLNVYTPNTLDDEEAREFWTINDSSYHPRLTKGCSKKYSGSINS